MHSGILAKRESDARRAIATALQALCAAHQVPFAPGPNLPPREMNAVRRLEELETFQANIEALCRQQKIAFHTPEPPAQGDTVLANPGNAAAQPSPEAVKAVADHADGVLNYITSKPGKPVAGETVFAKAPAHAGTPTAPATLTVGEHEVIEFDAVSVTVDGVPVEGVIAETDGDPGPAEQIDPGDPPAEPVEPSETAPAEKETTDNVSGESTDAGTPAEPVDEAPAETTNEPDERPTVDTLAKGKKKKK